MSRIHAWISDIVYYIELNKGSTNIGGKSYEKI